MPTTTGDPEAILIHSRLTEDSRVALVTADFALYRSCFHLPNVISTWDGASVFETAADLRRVFDGTLANLAALGVTRYERHPVSANFIDETKIEGIHESLLYARDRMAAPPLIVHTITERIGGRWLVTVGRYDVAATPILRHAFSSGRALTEEEAAKFGWGD